MYSDGFNPLLRFSVLLPGSGRKGVCVSFKTHLKQEQEYGMEIIEIAKLLPQSNRVLLFAFFRLLFAMNILPPSRLFTHLGRVGRVASTSYLHPLPMSWF